MGRQKSTPKKSDSQVDYSCIDYIPIVKKRKKRSQNKSEQSFNLTYPSDVSKQFYLGQLSLGSTNNVFPVNCKTVKVSFRFSNKESDDGNESDHISDAIVLDCDNVLIIIRSHIDTIFIKELISHKVFSFDFLLKDENVYLKIYFVNLPLPKFYPKLGNTIKTLCSLFFEVGIAADENSSKKIYRGGEINKFYDKLKESRENYFLPTDDFIKHPSLKPTLRPYQKKSVKWMLQKERISDSKTDTLHPLYVLIRLESGIEIYFDKFTGYISSEKPLVSPTSKGGILADEMGLGKTVEVLACILLNPKESKKEIPIDSEEEADNLPLSKRMKMKRVIESSDDDWEPENLLVTKRRKRKLSSEESNEDCELEIPLINRKPKRRKVRACVRDDKYVDKYKEIKVPKDWVKSSRAKGPNQIALEMWYNSILSDMSTVKPNLSEDPDRIVVQCICGDHSEDGIIKCTKCPKYQHKDCLGYKKTLGEYICPQCWMDKPLLDSKATLIVTPIALKTQWCKEICRHVKGKFKVLQYEGSNATSVYPTELKDYDIVLTTYSVLQNELRLTENGQEFNLRREKKYCTPGSPLTRLRWWRLCLDEAQTVEMPGRMVSEMARKIDAVYRWAVTGTPISKNLSDLYGLIDYLQITPYNDLTVWKKILYEPYLNGVEEPLINFLTPILWRTAKKDVTDQINIPKQTYLEHVLEFSAVEKYFYRREHELSSSDFLSKVTKFDSSLHLEDLDKSSLKKLLAPLLSLRHACTHPNTVRGRYLATKKQVTSMKELLNALILKNTNDSEDCLRLIISSLNGIAGIHLLQYNAQEAINFYREVLQLVAKFSRENGETKLTIDKPLVIHTLYNLAEVLELYPPDQPTLRDENLKKDCELLERKYLENFLSECTSAFESFSTIMLNIEKMQNTYILKDGQWYSDGLNWIFINGHYNELHTKLTTICDNASVQNTLRNASERTLLQQIYQWDDDLSDLRSNLFETIEDLYDNQPETDHKIVVKQDLVSKAMNCHLRPQKKGKQAPKCPVCIANDNLKKYEEKLFGMAWRQKTFEDMSLVGSWKPTLQELVMKALLAVLRAKHSKSEFIKDGELQISIIEQLKKEFKELRRLWTFLDKQICAKDELDICKVRLQLKTENDNAKVNKAIKNLNYDIDNKTETINLLSVHELDYQMSLLENDVKQHSAKLEKLLGTQSYLETLRKQQYEGQNPDPCPICKNTLELHWTILLCGHSYCLECIQVLLEKSPGDHIQCSICRNKQKYQDISYIKAGNTVTDADTKNIKGNYSTKIEGVIKLLLDLKNEDSAVKILLFSSLASVLKCLKEALSTNSISCELAHSGNLDDKITNFKDFSKDITVFLLPINLGSKGLNLIEATHVILVEPLLNPADELQAIGRVNRIGQTKATFVHKFLIKNTIEESIHQATTSNAENWEQSRVTLQHLVDLFDTSEALSELNESLEIPATSEMQDVSITEEEVQDSEIPGVTTNIKNLESSVVSEEVVKSVNSESNLFAGTSDNKILNRFLSHSGETTNDIPNSSHHP